MEDSSGRAVHHAVRDRPARPHAEVVQHGTIWDEANEKAKQLCEERGLTYIHPFDDMQLITGQGTLGLELFRDFPGVDVAVVPIGGGGLISGVSMAVKSYNLKIRVIGVESSDGPAMQRSVDSARRRPNALSPRPVLGR